MNVQPITYLVIEPKGPVSRIEGVLDLPTVQRIVGGDFEPLPQPRGVDAIVLAQQDGKSKGLEPNWSATSIEHSRLRPDDFVVGTVIVAGPPNEDGDLTSLSADAEAAIRKLAER